MTDFDSQWGCWGLIENMREPVSMKTKGFDAARTAPIPPNKLGAPLPVSKLPARHFMGNYHAQPAPYDAVNVSAYNGPVSTVLPHDNVLRQLPTALYLN